MKKILVCALTFLFSSAFAQKVEIFSNTPINAASTFTDMQPDADGVIHTAAGRLIFKKMTFPTFSRTTQATINITLASNGDRWDKSGSCFVIPQGSLSNLWEVVSSAKELPEATVAVGDMRGHALLGNYRPAIELLRFMTPFGVGHYSDDQLKRKPVYIPHWEKEVKWSQNIDQLIPLLQGEAIVGVWIDSWTPEGYKISVDVDFKESELECDKIRKTVVLPLLNTVYYIGAQGSPTMFAHGDVKVEFNLPKGAKNARLYYITTGHGGHSGGDEFVKQQNIVKVNDDVVIDFIPWRDDCASFRRFNPGSGVWIRKRIAPYIGEDGKYEQKEIEESLASSDLSRSNWCPGSAIVPEMTPLKTVKEGNNKITFSVPNAQKAEGDKFNHWLISAYITYEL